ncbi:MULTISPECIES: hypothetical protein [unclassified Saccharothrix]|uniref:hypothetical protein n=1 Tax=unclassified Saccharothrix TaxID=2593673 RepID=UPI00307F55D6
MGTGGVVAAAALAGVVAAGAGGLAAPDDEPWRALGLEVVDRVTQDDSECVSHSFGQVRDLLTATPCVSLTRLLMTVRDDDGTLIAVSAAWVQFERPEIAAEWKRVEDIHGTGDISPLSSSLLQLDPIKFTAHHYDSQLLDTTVVIAESEPVEGQPTPELLKDVAKVAVRTPRP